MQTRDSVVRFYRFLAFGALADAVSFYPVVQHGLWRLLGLDVGGDTRRWRPLHAALVHSVLANWRTGSAGAGQLWRWKRGAVRSQRYRWRQDRLFSGPRQENGAWL